MSKAAGFAIKAIGIILALTLAGLWAYWVWQWDWGVFLRNRRWIFCFFALVAGTPVILMMTGAAFLTLGEWVEERNK